MKYIEINDPYYNFNNKCFYLDIDLVDEENQDIKTKSIILTKPIWYFLFPKKLQVDYEKRKDFIHKKIKEWLIKYMDKIKKNYEDNWEQQPEIKKINNYEIELSSKDIKMNWL